MTTETNSNRPTHRVYAVIKKEGREKGTWLEIDAAWPHHDGKGYGVTLNFIPRSPDAELVIRAIEPKPALQLRLALFPKASQKCRTTPASVQHKSSLAALQRQGRQRRVVSTGRCNTLSLREKMECDDGSEISSWFYRSREDGVMGSLATR